MEEFDVDKFMEDAKNKFPFPPKKKGDDKDDDKGDKKPPFPPKK